MSDEDSANLRGLYVTRYSCWLEWYAKHGHETLTCDLDRINSVEE